MAIGIAVGTSGLGTVAGAADTLTDRNLDAVTAGAGAGVGVTTGASSIGNYTAVSGTYAATQANSDGRLATALGAGFAVSTGDVGPNSAEAGSTASGVGNTVIWSSHGGQSNPALKAKVASTTSAVVAVD